MSLNGVQSFVIENCNGPTIENGLNNVCLHPLSRTFTFTFFTTVFTVEVLNLKSAKTRLSVNPDYKLASLSTCVIIGRYKFLKMSIFATNQTWQLILEDYKTVAAIMSC